MWKIDDEASLNRHNFIIKSNLIKYKGTVYTKELTFYYEKGKDFNNHMRFWSYIKKTKLKIKI